MYDLLSVHVLFGFLFALPSEIGARSFIIHYVVIIDRFIFVKVNVRFLETKLWQFLLSISFDRTRLHKVGYDVFALSLLTLVCIVLDRN